MTQQRNSFRLNPMLAVTCLIAALASAGMGGYLLWVDRFLDARTLGVIALIALSCGLVFRLYGVRLDDEELRFGLGARGRLAYSSISEILDIRKESKPRMTLITIKGSRVGIWSSLERYEDFLSELRTRSGATYRKIV